MAEMIDLTAEAAEKRRAYLVGIRRIGESEGGANALLDELAELVANLDIEVVGREVVLLREPSAHYLVGTGKFESVAAAPRWRETDWIVLDEERSPPQHRHLV